MSALEHLPWWVWPFVASLVLISTHTYLGLHVIQRKVLFVDLALAQIAGLGSTVAFLFGYELQDSMTYWISLCFAGLGAFFFSYARTRGERVPQEAIIGLSFAIASALSILLSAENPHGAEHLRDILAGSILVVTPKDVGVAAGVYLAIMAFHWIFRGPLLKISADPEAAEKEGLRVERWDLLFYGTFALVITISVKIAGVLLVFTLLIAPAVCAALFTDNFRKRLLIGWATSVASAIGGLILSSRYDWPPAPSIICLYMTILIGCGVASHVMQAPNKARAFVRIALTGAVVAGAMFAMLAVLRGSAPHSEDHEDTTPKAAEESGVTHDRVHVPDLINALKDPSTAVKEKAAEALGRIGDPTAIDPLLDALKVVEEDEWVRLREAEALAALGNAKGIEVLEAMAQEAEAKRVRIEAQKLAEKLKPKAH